jgi:hypothetical protein
MCAAAAGAVAAGVVVAGAAACGAAAAGGVAGLGEVGVCAKAPTGRAKPATRIAVVTECFNVMVMFLSLA